jgi:hypothetical protein
VNSNIVYVQDRAVCMAVPSVSSDFQADLREALAGQLRRERYVIPPSAKDRDVHIMWGNVRLRHVPRRRRRTLWSEELRQRSLDDAELRGSIRRVCQASERGENLNPHLSRKHLTASFNDLLFNDWRIHHMHLGPRGGKRTGRTNTVLFALVTKDVLHLIDALDHKDDETVFADVSLVEIMHRNFRNAMPLVAMPGIAPGRDGRIVTKEERSLGRKAGLQMLVQIGDMMFGPAGGIATSGDNVRAVSATDDLRRAVNCLEQQIHAAPHQFAETIFQATGARPAILNFKLLAAGTAFSIAELNSDWRLNVFDFAFSH